MSSISRFDVIQNLVGGGLSGTPEGDKGEINYLDGQTPPTESEIDAEVARLEKEFSDNEYARQRQTEYPTIEECVHAMLDNDNTELDTLQAKRAEIKLKYPKGG